MKNFFHFFASRNRLATLVTIMILVLGALALSTMKRDSFPQVEFGEVFVMTTYPGASAEDVEINVTNKLEDALNGVTGIEKMTSVSAENKSSIKIQIDPDENIDDVVADIKDAVDSVNDLPSEVEDVPIVREVETSSIPVIEVGLAAPEGFDYRTLRNYAKQLEKRIKRIPGVSKIDRFGFLDREVQIQVDPDKLAEYELSMTDIIQAVSARNIRSTSGTFESYTSEKNVVTLAEFTNPNDVNDVIVRASFNGPAVHVSDLATVVDGFEDETVLSHINGKPAISFVAFKSEGADVIRTVDAIKDLVTDTKVLLPKDITVEYSNDMSKHIRNRLKVVMSNAGLGLVLVLILLSIFFNRHSAFWVAIGIPVTVAGTFFLMPLFDAYIEVVSLAAMIIVIGIIVDDAIIISENITKKREEGLAPIDAAIEGAREVFLPVITTILTTFIAFAPMFFVSGIMGKFIFVIPLVISLALFISLIEVTIALPAHMVPGLAKINPKQKDEKATWFDPIQTRFKTLITTILNRRYWLVLGFIGLFITSMIYAVTKMDFDLFPSEAADTFWINIDLPIGTSLKATADHVKKIETIVQQLPDNELQSFVTRIGAQTQSDGISMSESERLATIIINLTHIDQRDRIADEIVAGLRTQTDALNNFEKINYVIDGGGPPVGSPIELRVVGDDDVKRTALADDIMAYLDTRDDVTDLQRDDTLGKDQIEINLNYDKLARVGLSVSTVAQYLRITYDGQDVSSTRYNDEDVDFRVQAKETARKNLRQLKTLKIPNNQNRLISLGDIASFDQSPGPSNFYHYDGERSITLKGSIKKGQTTPIKVISDILARYNLNQDWQGLDIVVGGEAEETNASISDLLNKFIIAALGIYFLLILLFNSYTQPFLVLAAIPFGLMGVILAFALHQKAFGFLALMGVIGLSGVVVNDSLVLIDHLNNLRKQHPKTPLLTLVAQGTTNRLRPITITSLTTIAGLLPLAYGLGGSDPLIAPMALSLGYGILFATPLTLVLLPCLFMVYDDVRQWLSSGRR